MTLANLHRLHASMVNLGVTNQQFSYNIRTVSFDCLFSIGQAPFLLCLTARGNRPAFFKFAIGDDFQAPKSFEGDDYRTLGALLRTNGTSGNKLIPSEFFAEFDAATPIEASRRNVPRPSELLRLRSDITEHRDRPYFDTWIYWTGETNGPTRENKAKTLALLGEEALQHSETFKASTRWSATNTGREWTLERRQHIHKI